MKIVFCSSEVVPFAKTGGMADVCGTLPLALEKLGQELIIVLPGYRVIDRKKFGFTRILDNVSAATLGKNIKVYLIEHEGYFGRPGLYGDQEGDYEDNLARFDFYCRQTLELFKELKMPVDIIHCHDWQAALIPVYLKTQYKSDPFYRNTKSILSLHNLPFGDKIFADAFEFYGQLNLLKAGIVLSDEVATVSPQYSHEIQTKEFGCGLEGVLLSRGAHVAGILNGLDYDHWNPQTDPHIKIKYSVDNPEAKAHSKEVLQREFKLPVKPRIPLFGFVSRLSHQKGIDLLEETMPMLMKMDIQIAFLGVGEAKYHRMLNNWVKQYPGKIGAQLIFSEDFSHEVYAGSDLFLMPSVYEPCGLSQMISLRYGTVPVVYRTGGLVDTVTPYSQNGNGFIFDKYTKTSFFEIVKEADKIYHNQELFKQIIRRGMQANFSWEDSARKYNDLYKRCLTPQK